MPRRTPESTDPFTYPTRPDHLPTETLDKARPWASLDEFDLLVQAEERCGHAVDIKRTTLPDSLWGFSFTDQEKTHTRIFINKGLSEEWQRFTLYHELHHLLYDQKGMYFFERNSYANLDAVERAADLFAWAVIWLQEQQELGPDEEEGWDG